MSGLEAEEFEAWETRVVDEIGPALTNASETDEALGSILRTRRTALFVDEIEREEPADLRRLARELGVTDDADRAMPSSRSWKAR
ncbi:hypothetical protein [Streptomyces lydicus]|uniref:Uncharacterized protein n=1 Tax=Streptomyces lydicus TaxID=47763 RepID=A0A1D7VP09_9ACTN|nr:hypothetical protein [Streptomyces lydicus]AOP48495.1 hypothetical protein SL103_21670 [Streptomyces lydicus]